MRFTGHLLILGTLLAAVALGAFAPDRFYGLMQEDALAEWATFVAFGIAGVLSCRLAYRAKTPLDRFAGIALAAFTIFVAGEEISWAHRLAAFEPPDIFLEHNYQQELNFHNLLKSVLDTRWMVTIVALGYGVVLPIAVRFKRFERFASLAPLLSLAPWFGVVAALEIIYPFKLTGELAELMLGLTFVLDLDTRAKENFVLPLHAMTLGIALLVTPFLEAWIYGPAPQNVVKVRQELDELSREFSSRKRLRRKRSVHKRLFTAVKSRYVRFERDGYFLDPWNQPYWLRYTRIDGKVVLYSFGPNRRRDWDPRSARSEIGDDIIVTIDSGLAQKGRDR